MSETGLSTLRLLGRAGVVCFALDAIEPLPAFWSRYCRRSVRLDPHTPEPRIVQAIISLAAELPPRPVLMPTSDRMVQLVSRNREQLEPLFEILLPERDVVEDLLDKSRFAARTAMLGAPVPRGGTIDGIKELSHAAARFGLPLIIKPVRQNDIAGTNFPKALLLQSQEQVTAAAEKYAGCNDMRLVAQEYIPGGDSQQISVAACLDRQGRVLATFTARKRRQGTNGTGVGLYVERIDDLEAEAIAVDLLRQLKCVGIAEVELKRHAQTGRLYVIEINLRVWLQVALPARCGINYPAMFYEVARGGTPGPVTVEPATLRPAAWQDLFHDCYVTFRRGGYFHRRDVSLLQWLKQSICASAGPYFSVRDPLPSMAWMGHVLGKLLLPHRRTPSSAQPARPVAPAALPAPARR